MGSFLAGTHLPGRRSLAEAERPKEARPETFPHRYGPFRFGYSRLRREQGFNGVCLGFLRTFYWAVLHLISVPHRCRFVAIHNAPQAIEIIVERVASYLQ